MLAGSLALAWASRAGAASDGWSQEAISAPSGGVWIHLRDVSCTSTGACIAVGFYSDNSSKVVPLAESWNGSSWSAQTVPVPSGAKRSQLEGVSCSSASACIAVGSYVNSSGEEVPLAESGNGSSWSVQIPSAPGGVQASWLESVSCSSQSDCIAVGGYEDGSSEYEPLAESWNGSSEQKQETKEPSPPAASGRSGRLGIAVPAREAAVLQGYALVRLRCTGEGACRTPLALIDRMVVRHVVRSHGKRRLVSRVSRIVIGKAWVSIPARGRDVVPIKFSRKGMSLLMHAPRHRLRVVLVGKHVKKGAIVLVLRSSSAGTAGNARNP